MTVVLALARWPTGFTLSRSSWLWHRRRRHRRGSYAIRQVFNMNTRQYELHDGGAQRPECRLLGEHRHREGNSVVEVMNVNVIGGTSNINDTECNPSVSWLNPDDLSDVQVCTYTLRVQLSTVDLDGPRPRCRTHLVRRTTSTFTYTTPRSGSSFSL